MATDSFGEYPSVAACSYHGVDGEEEMYLFFSLAWFDLGSWAWAHYIAEWGTKGIFTVRSRHWLASYRATTQNLTCLWPAKRTRASDI